MQMLRDTFQQGGGRVLESFNGGELYEVASLREKMRSRDKMEAFNFPMPPGCYAVKSSVEGAKIKEVQFTRRFHCDGTMYRHTKRSRTDSPFECREFHVVCCTKDEAVKAFAYEQLIEDLTPYDCEIYWQTVWIKCEACQTSDLQFADWVRSQGAPGCGTSTISVDATEGFPMCNVIVDQ